MDTYFCQLFGLYDDCSHTLSGSDFAEDAACLTEATQYDVEAYYISEQALTGFTGYNQAVVLDYCAGRIEEWDGVAEACLEAWFISWSDGTYEAWCDLWTFDIYTTSAHVGVFDNPTLTEDGSSLTLWALDIDMQAATKQMLTLSYLVLAALALSS